jgi:hypothetical protein
MENVRVQAEGVKHARVHEVDTLSPMRRETAWRAASPANSGPPPGV